MKLGKRILKKLIKIVKKISKGLLDEVKLKAVDKLLKKKNKKGAPIQYDRPALFRLICDSFHDGKRSAHAIARYSKKPFVRLKYWITKSPSHDTISNFFNELIAIIDEIFELIVREAKNIGLFKTYVPKLIDTTDLSTKFRSDPDAQWNYDSSKKRWYWGYGGLLVIDAENHLPCAAMLVSSKKVNGCESIKVSEKTLSNVGADIVLGDPEFDMNSLRHYIESNHVMFITPYNPRNSKQKHPVKYRNELIAYSDFEWLDTEYKSRVEIEHSIGTMKENCGLEEIYVKGYKKVKVHFFLALCVRLLNGIVTFQKGLNPRKVTMI